MKNIKNTIQYVQAIGIVLIAVVFAISPISARAQGEPDYGSYVTDGSTATEPSYGSYYTDNTVSEPSYGSYYTDNSSVYTPTYSTVSSGGFSGGTMYSSYAPTYYPSSSWVSSGSYSAPANNPVYAPVYVPPTSNVVSGSFSGISPVYTQPTYYQQPTTVVPNQVLAFTDTNPSLNSVYLSDVPYTGFSDYYGIILFISILVSWSAILAYMFLKRKMKATVFATAYVEASQSNDEDDSIASDFMNQIASDTSDIREVEEYARMKKVLLSTDAATTLVKIQRLGKGSAADIINSFSTNEWTAVGEKELEKYN